METQAVLRGVRISAQKGRLVADQVRGKSVEAALNILNFSPKKAAKILKKVLESAIANAEHNDGADVDELRVSRVHVEKGQSLRRFSARAKGRADREGAQRAERDRHGSEGQRDRNAGQRDHGNRSGGDQGDLANDRATEAVGENTVLARGDGGSGQSRHKAPFNRTNSHLFNN